MRKQKIWKAKQWLSKDHGIYILRTNKWSELAIHARINMILFCLCVGKYKNGDVVSIKDEVSIVMGKRQARVDIMLFCNEKPICAVEIKRDRAMRCTPQFKRQEAIYKEFHSTTGIPVFYCFGFDEIRLVAYTVRQFLFNKCNLTREDDEKEAAIET